MYGLLIENLASFIRVQWGEGKWDSVRKHAGVDAPSFSIHHVYSETLLQRLARSACQILGVDERQFFEAMGVYFVEYVGHYGYDKMLLVLGRHLRDFLNGLDNLHEYLKFSYTKMRAPSFYCDDESATGLRLHYRSKRRGFIWYTMGQIKQVAKHFYEQDIEIEVVSEELDGETMHTIFKLTFDNQAFVEHESLRTIMRKESQLPIRASIIFELFPFCIVFSTEMIITYTGHALLTILKDLVGQGMTEAFEIIRPNIAFAFNTILERRNNIFELITTSPIKEESLDDILEDEEAEGVRLRLRGQMLMMEEWDMMLFLANPVMPDLPSLVAAGIYINDLSLHDCSRDLVLAGTQQSVELKLALDQEQHKSKKLEESMKKLDDEMKRTDELLYQMIPKQVADRLRKGESSVSTCEVFDSVSILFSDVVTFTDICSKITPLEVVSMLNHMYSLFDQLTERNGVYKVETIGDSYMVVSGAPNKEETHSERIADMAMDMIDASRAIKDPSRDDAHLKLRVGCHSGNVVAGVVGVKMPRYCLFGDAVNTASRMESSSVANQIQISEACKERLPPTYKVELRGTVNVKGKGEMNTYWLQGRESRVPLSKVQAASFDWTEPDKPGSRRSSRAEKGRKSSVISASDPAEAAKSRESSEAPPATRPPLQQQMSVSKANAAAAAAAVMNQAPRKLQPPTINEPKAEEETPETPTPSPAPEATPSPAPAAASPAPAAASPAPAAASPAPAAAPSPPPAPKPNSDKPVNPPAAQQKAPEVQVNPPTDTERGRSSSKNLEPQTSTDKDSAGNRMDLNVAGSDLYKSARRLSNALRSRSPSRTPPRSRPSSGKTVININEPQKTPKPEPPKPSPSPTEKKVTLVRQVTLKDLPDKLAEVINNNPELKDLPNKLAEAMNNNPEEIVNIVRMPSGETIVEKSGPDTTSGKEAEVICIVTAPTPPASSDNVDAANANTIEQTDPDQERESFLINVKMKKGQNNGNRANGFKKTINGLAFGISRLPKNEALRKKIRENKIAVVTTDVLTDMGCVAFADKQRQVLSQACSIL